MDIGARFLRKKKKKTEEQSRLVIKMCRHRYLEALKVVGYTSKYYTSSYSTLTYTHSPHESTISNVLMKSLNFKLYTVVGQATKHLYCICIVG